MSGINKMCFPVITAFDLKLPYYFTGVGCEYLQEDIVRPNGHPSFQWIQCRSGKGEVYIGGKRYIVGEGQGLFLFPDEPHSYHAIDGDWLVDWIIFRGSEVSSFVLNVLGLRKSAVRYIKNPHIIMNKLSQIYACSVSDSPTANVSCSVLVYEILADILALTSDRQASDIPLKKINPVIAYIDKHYTGQIALADLADIAEVTPQHLCSIFKKCTSYTPFEYIIMKRIQKSKELLLGRRDMQIQEIAAAVGFNDTSYFCAVFRKIERISPGEFRIL